MRMAGTIRVRAETLEEMLRHARHDAEIECCGLLAGRNGIITAMLPGENSLASATAYEIAPQELFCLFRQMREEGLEHLGMYHSHPAGENVPSPRDIEQAYYPDQAYFVLSPGAESPKPVRAFAIRNGVAQELEIVSTQS